MCLSHPLQAPASGLPEDIFLALLPKLQKHAQIQFRSTACADRRADKIAEVIALAWQWHVRLLERGKDVRQFTMVFIYLVVTAVKSGRRVTGMEKLKDVLSPRAQRRHGFVVDSLSARPMPCQGGSLQREQKATSSYEERLHDNTVTPPADAAAFRIDFPQFLMTHSCRDRAVAMFLAQDHSAKEAAEEFKISPGRVTQLRKRWHKEWQAFQE
jgi:hypothetical protein